MYFENSVQVHNKTVRPTSPSLLCIVWRSRLTYKYINKFRRVGNYFLKNCFLQILELISNLSNLIWLHCTLKKPTRKIYFKINGIIGVMFTYNLFQTEQTTESILFLHQSKHLFHFCRKYFSYKRKFNMLLEIVFLSLWLTVFLAARLCAPIFRKVIGYWYF